MIIRDYDNTVIDIGCATFKYSIITIFKTKIPKATVSTLIIYYLYTPIQLYLPIMNTYRSSSLRYLLQSFTYTVYQQLKQEIGLKTFQRSKFS